MLRELRSMEEYEIGAIDGRTGRVKDFLFDDEAWDVKYVVVKTEDGISPREVLISTQCLSSPSDAGHLLPAHLTRRQVRNSCEIASTDFAPAKHAALGDPHLRSAKAVLKYCVHASDGPVGHVSGFLIEDQTWRMRYMVVHVGNAWPRLDALIEPARAEYIGWTESAIRLGLSRNWIKAAPRYEPDRAQLPAC